MAVTTLTDPCDIVLYYYLFGNNNRSNMATYRSDNPWQTLKALREELSRSGGSLRRTLGIERLYHPDGSVWRIQVVGGEDSVNVATRLLQYIEGHIAIRSEDTFLAIARAASGNLVELFIEI